MSKVKTILAGTFSAMKHRNYRLFWTGEVLSLTGTWLQGIAQSWLVLELTHSAFKLGLVAMAQFLPMLLLSLYAGTLVDRYKKRNILLVSQGLLLLLALILAILTQTHWVSFWHILLLALALGVINTIAVPARQSFFIELVGKEDFLNAIALNSSIFNLSRILGPAIGGLLIGWVGLAPCFYINAASYVPVLITLLMIPAGVGAMAKKKPQSLRLIYVGILQGLRYIRRRDALRLPILLLAVVSAFTMNFNIMIPLFAQNNLGQNATGYGFLMTIMAIGSFLGSLSLATRGKDQPRFWQILGASFGMSATVLLMGFLGNYLLAALTILATGYFAMLFTAMINTTLQLHSGDHIRGRVISVYSLVLGGLTPIGSFYAGSLIEHFGAGFCMILSGLIGVGATLYVLLGYRKNPKVAKIQPTESR